MQWNFLDWRWPLLSFWTFSPKFRTENIPPTPSLRTFSKKSTIVAKTDVPKVSKPLLSINQTPGHLCLKKGGYQCYAFTHQSKNGWKYKSLHSTHEVALSDYDACKIQLWANLMKFEWNFESIIRWISCFPASTFIWTGENLIDRSNLRWYKTKILVESINTFSLSQFCICLKTQIRIFCTLTMIYITLVL